MHYQEKKGAAKFINQESRNQNNEKAKQDP